MKYQLLLCALLLVGPGRTRADALNKQHIAADAKWVVHVDLDNLRQTKIGDSLIKQFVDPHVAQIGSQFKINASNILQRVNSLTAYGADFKQGPDSTGVLMINSDSQTQKALEGLLVAQILANTNGPVKKLENTDLVLYSLANQIFISPQKDGPILISKSQEQIETARDALLGKGPSLAATTAFSEYPGLAHSFLFVALNDASKVPNTIPAQAKILQMAEGGAIALGEKDDQVFLNLTLRGKTVEVTRQIQQVVEGMLALVAIGQPDNTDILELAKSTKVSSAGQLITIKLEYPASKVMEQLNEQLAPKPSKDKVAHKKPHSKMKKAAIKPQAEEDDAPAEETAPASK